MVHSLNCIPNLTSNCSYNCINLENVLDIKYLGLILDYRLIWNRHINFINNNLLKFFYIFKDTKNIFHNYYKKIIYLSVVQSFYSYGLSIWGGTYNIHLSRLKVTINCLIKYLYESLNVKNFIFIYNLSVLIDLYKHKHFISTNT